jgi:predicted transglutaminase-like cysteine proteinase
MIAAELLECGLVQAVLVSETLFVRPQKIVLMAIRNRSTTSHRARYWALVTGLLLASAFIAWVQIQLPPYSAGLDSSFNSGGIESVAFVEDGPNAVTREPVPPTRNDKEAALFGMDTVPLNGGEVLRKWNSAKAGIDQALQTVDRCRTNTNNECPAEAQRLIDLISEGAGRNARTKVSLINRAVNLAIRQTSDEAQWHETDNWSAPFETLQSGRGDCEDYAIVKYLAMLAAGMSADDVKIVIVKNVFPNEDHAVVATRVDDEWLILDNRTLALVRDADLTRAIPEVVLDQAGVKRLVSKRLSAEPAEPPLVQPASRRFPSPLVERPAGSAPGGGQVRRQ